jgi:uncharacterized protein YkwD
MRSSSLRFLSLLPLAGTLVVLAVVAAPANADAAVASISARCPGADNPARHGPRSSAVRATLCLLNAERRRHGARPLRHNGRLARASRVHSRVMTSRRVFAHATRYDGAVGHRVRRAGYLRGVRRWMVGENIGWGSGRLDTPRSMMVAWMRSPGHRANILNGRYREVGIGIVPRGIGHRGRAGTYTTTFGARR